LDNGTAVLIGLGLGGINILTFALFAIDKDRARRGDWRLSEGTLLMAAFLGGSFGAKLAQHRFRHKTGKEPFRSMLNTIVGLHVILAVVLVFPPLRVALWTVLSPAVLAETPEPAPKLPRRFGPGS